MGLPVLSPEAILRVLATAGFEQVSQKGSHIKVRNAQGRSAIVPRHREVAVGTLRSILRQVGLSPDEFLGLLGRE